MLDKGKMTMSRKKHPLTEVHTSALADHVAETNHIIDWESIKHPMEEEDWITLGIQEFIII